MLYSFLSVIESPEDRLFIGQIYDEYKQQMFTVAFSILEDIQEAEDTVHDVFENIAKTRVDFVKTLTDPQNLKNYILKATKNVALNRLKRRNKEMALLGAGKAILNLNVPHAIDVDFVEWVCANAEYEALLNAIKSLEYPYGDVLFYRFAFKMSVDDIAKLLGRKKSTVKMQLVRGKKYCFQNLDTEITKKMAMTKDQFEKAFIDAASAEFEDVLSSTEAEHVFSERFEKRMQKLIKQERSPLRHLTNTGAKRAAIVALAVIILLLCACAVKPVREYIAGFFTELHDTYYEIFFEKETAVIEDEYYISSIPEGFELDEAGSIISDAIITKRYINSNDDEIIFSQTMTESTYLSLDSELGDMQELKTPNGREIALYTLDNVLLAMWIEDGYLFEIVIYGNYDKDCILTLVDSVTCK